MSEQNFQALIAEIKRGATVEILDHSLIAVPGENGREIVSVEKHLAHPSRKRGAVTVFDAASFITYLNDQGATQETAAIYVDKHPGKPAIVGVLNHDITSNGAAGWRDHTVSIGFRTTPEWQTWVQASGRMFAQRDFAEFLEDNMQQIQAPIGGDLMRIAENIEVTSDGKCRSAQRLDNGAVQFSYDEDVKATVKNGKQAIEIPQEFQIALSPFQGTSVYAITARFRWRFDREGGVTMGYKLLRLDDVVRAAIDGLVKPIEAGTNISIYEGAAPAAVAYRG